MSFDEIKRDLPNPSGIIDSTLVITFTSNSCFAIFYAKRLVVSNVNNMVIAINLNFIILIYFYVIIRYI